MVPQADELWMVCFYTELRGRAPKGMEQIDPLETILALEFNLASQSVTLVTLPPNIAVCARIRL